MYLECVDTNELEEVEVRTQTENLMTSVLGLCNTVQPWVPGPRGPFPYASVATLSFPRTRYGPTPPFRNLSNAAHLSTARKMSVGANPFQSPATAGMY